jgi:BirA family biotin operon repressor/biotin-[acetyl-CoA-carboxylase] ligase
VILCGLCPHKITAHQLIFLWYNKLMDEHSLADGLAGLPIPSIHYFESIGSTNDYARSLAENAAPDGTLVIADEQTQGRGRLNRRWETRPGVALAFSLVLHPSPQEMPNLSLFSALCGMAVCATLQMRFGLEAQVKWPNDVLIKRRKTCGVLVEALWLGSELQGVIAGIGVNIAPSSLPLQDGLIFPATCVENELGHPVDRERLLLEILQAFFSLRAGLGSPEFFAEWEKWLAFKGEWVRVEQPESTLEGRLAGIARDGSLRLQLQSGEIVEIALGDIRLRSTL